MNIMLDIETLGVKNDAVVAQIAAVVFTSDYKIVDEFCMNVDTDAQVLDGRSVSKETLKFWAKQDKEVIASVFHENVKHPEEVSNKFFKFLSQYRKIPFWAQGILFDWPIINNFIKQYSKCSLTSMFNFWQLYDLRTFRNEVRRVATNAVYTFEKELESEYKMAHNALDDCKKQVKLLAWLRETMTNNYTWDV